MFKNFKTGHELVRCTKNIYIIFVHLLFSEKHENGSETFSFFCFFPDYSFSVQQIGPIRVARTLARPSLSLLQQLEGVRQYRTYVGTTQSNPFLRSTYPTLQQMYTYVYSVHSFFFLNKNMYRGQECLSLTLVLVIVHRMNRRCYCQFF